MSAETLALRAEAVRAETMRKGQVQHSPLLLLFPLSHSTVHSFSEHPSFHPNLFSSSPAVRCVLDVLNYPHGAGAAGLLVIHWDIQSIGNNRRTRIVYRVCELLASSECVVVLDVLFVLEHVLIQSLFDSQYRGCFVILACVYVYWDEVNHTSIGDR